MEHSKIRMISEIFISSSLYIIIFISLFDSIISGEEQLRHVLCSITSYDGVLWFAPGTWSLRTEGVMTKFYRLSLVPSR